MLKGRIERRKLIALGALALVAGCKVIPTVAPPPTPPAPVPSDTLPADQARHRIALLVPLSGQGADLGQSIANAANMALLDTNAQTIRITTYDTASGPAAAAAQALKDGNRLILGPVLGEEVAPVAATARRSSVPLITYSGDSAAAAPDVFLLGVTENAAIERVVGHAHAKGARRFALLAPKGEYGARAAAAFSAALKVHGDSLVASDSYDRTNTSIVSAAQRLKAKGGFDAVLIADSARLAALAAPRIKATGALAPRILGLDLWSGEAALNTTPSLRGAWFAALPDLRYRQFADSYKTRFGAAPFRQATLGYDSALLSVRIAREWKPGAPFPTARLLDTGGFLGLDGPFRFTADGQGQRALEVREVRAGGVTIVSPAPERFAD